jgi:hypothetical protein
VRRIQLKQFLGRCTSSGVFGPHVLCDGELVLELAGDSGSRLVSSSVKRMDVGPRMVAFGDPFGTPAGGHLTIGSQAAILVNRLVGTSGPPTRSGTAERTCVLWRFA